MIGKIRQLIRKVYLNRLISRGLTIGENFNMEKDCNIDAGFPWMICIGDNVTLASGVYIIAHDASTKHFFNKSKVGGVEIGSNVFVGARSVILPNVHIGNNVVIGAGSCVAQNVESGTVVAGNPAKKIQTIEEFIEKNQKKMDSSPIFDSSYTLQGCIGIDKKIKMKEELFNKIGFID